MTIKIDLAVWSRPSAGKDLVLPGHLTTGAGFSVFRGKDVQRAVVDGRPWFDEGGVYLGLFNYMDPELKFSTVRPPGHPVWGPIAWMRLSGGRVRQVFNPGEPSTRRFKGMTAEDVAAVLERTKPDSRAQPFMDEDPARRYQHASGADI